jgi:hypothetical protein
LHHHDNDCASDDKKYYQPSKVTAGRIVMQRRGAITELGECRKKGSISSRPLLPIQRGFSQYLAALNHMEHGPWLMERAESISRKFEAGIRFQKCDVTGCYWAGSGKGVGQMEMTRACGPPDWPWKSLNLSVVLIVFFFLAQVLIFRSSKWLKKNQSLSPNCCA